MSDAETPDLVPPVVRLADAQLRAYNAGDIDAFCACYADDVRVLDADGACTVSGIAAFRERYGALFANHVLVRGDIVGRLALPPHLVERELWQRRETADSPLEDGEVLVRYTERDGKIAVVAFMR